MVGNGKVQARIAEIQAVGAEKAGVTIDRIVAELAKIAFSDLRRALDWGMKHTEIGPVPYPVLLKHKAPRPDRRLARVDELGPDVGHAEGQGRQRDPIRHPGGQRGLQA